MDNTTRTEHTDERQPTPEEVEAALRYYVRNHLKEGDLESIPALRKFI